MINDSFGRAHEPESTPDFRLSGISTLPAPLSSGMIDLTDGGGKCTTGSPIVPPMDHSEAFNALESSATTTKF
jgi:hypothetical protein